MKIILPMAGTGDRFKNKGHTDPKPLIFVNNRRIIEYILDIFDNDDKFIFICNDNHLQNTNMRKILLDLKPNSQIIGIPPHKKGPVFTTKYAYEYIEDNEEVLISYCDSPFIWKRSEFENHVNSHNLDGCLVTHTGFQPHFLETTKMAFVKTSCDYPLILEVQEKKSYTNNPQNEHASSGCYYFKQGSYIKKYFELLMNNDTHYNNEYFITLVYNLLIKDGLRVGYYDSLKTIMLGTPESVDNFESWMKLLKGDQCKNIQDIKNCYNYWKDYNENYIS